MTCSTYGWTDVYFSVMHCDDSYHNTGQTSKTAPHINSKILRVHRRRVCRKVSKMWDIIVLNGLILPTRRPWLPCSWQTPRASARHRDIGDSWIPHEVISMSAGLSDLHLDWDSTYGKTFLNSQTSLEHLRLTCVGKMSSGNIVCVQRIGICNSV